ncbi:Putative down-regulated-in-metastasis protein [Septoria linicola]|uniref:Down-regulated-in-metastasis protein n=1 Tax=Septoria linicola TaxID=215465 RepID=A0A9Q9B2M7_9PEZI|nr:Putative down-regulated-in-metastasis protein [Septoria linicola]
MASMSRGGRVGKAAKASKVVKPKSQKSKTPHQKNYRFQSFNERIANLKIDPIRRRRHVEASEKEAEITHTYFGESLSEWRDTNLSTTFSAFAKEAAVLCDNLPVVLHHEDHIVNLLMEYIEKGDALAMEPLLNLLWNLARDLDTHFEKHFQRAVATVLAVAAKHEDLTVINWSFDCLAWLFKHLSRLLVPDLRPLYDLLAPHIGKEKQRPFVVRYAAEAFSFLVRKAAILYERDAKPLDIIITHILQDCANTAAEPSADLHQQGVMAMFSEAIRGVQQGLASGGAAILQAAYASADNVASDQLTVISVERIICGVLTDYIHFTNQEGFKPVIATIVTYAQTKTTNTSASQIRLRSSLLFTAISVRKASRITDWKAVVQATEALSNACEALPKLETSLAQHILGLYAVVLQNASIGALQTLMRTLDRFRHGKWAAHFVNFCEMVLRLGTERFVEVLLPGLQKFVLERSALDEPDLLVLLTRVGTAKLDIKFRCSKSAIKDILARVEQVGASQQCSTEVVAHANIVLGALPHLAIDEQSDNKLRDSLRKLVTSALDQQRPMSHETRSFVLGPVLQQLLKATCGGEDIPDVWTMLCQASPEFSDLPAFWSNVLRYIQSHPPQDCEGSHCNILEYTLVSSLSTASHSIRQDALDILHELYQLRQLQRPSILATAMTLECIPISLETARSISMNIRRLPPQYAELEDGDPMQRAIPTYLFGLLHLNLAQAWDDACEALSAICQSKVGEEVIINLAQTWLDSKSDDEPTPESSRVIDVETDGFKAFSSFECPNCMKFLAIRKQVFEEPHSGLPTPEAQLAIDGRTVPRISLTARTQALRVLNKIPQVAEKRSRLLVPVLLRWAGSQVEENDDSLISDRWARKDQKALLAIFAQFNNPKVLYKAETVFDALLALCANGDLEIQKSALKAVLAWKDKSLTRYEEHLNNLLDENRFREEISVFLHDATDTEGEDEGVRAEDHPSLMPVLLRLLYGRAVAGGKEGQAGRRKAIFVALSRFGEKVLGDFLDITFKPIAASKSDDAAAELPTPAAPLRQQLGLVNMMVDMLQVLGDSLERFAPKLVRGILACTVSAARQLDQAEGADTALARSIRQTGVQCLVKIFSSMTAFDAETYGRTIITELIQPRLSSFAVETAQSVSGTLRLFSAWSERGTTSILFTGSGSTILRYVTDLLQGQHTKGEVQIFILKDVLDNLVTIDIEDFILQPHVSSFVKAIGSVIEQQPSKEVLDACVHSFSQLAGRITSESEASHVTKTCTELLKKPNRQVAPSTKSGLLQTILPLIENFGIDAKDNLYEAICVLYSRLSHAESRVLLSKVLAALVRDDAALLDIAQVCEDMNARGTRLDEPDYKRRDGAFNNIKTSSQTFTIEQWLPLVHNLLYYIRDAEDRVNRTDSSYALQLFITSASTHSAESQWMTLLEDAVLAGVERGMHEKSELVRAEYCQLLNHIVETFPDWQKVNCLRIRGHDDEETSFFLNVLHIQLRRRMAAVQVLESEAANVGSNSASRILLPLLEHFVFDAAEGEAGLNLANQTRKTIGALGKALNKNAFRATFQRYTGYLKNKEKDDYETIEKRVLQLLREMVDGIYAMPVEQRPITEAIIREQLTPLLEYLRQKDESTVDRRISIAVTIVKLMSGLPKEEFASRLPGVLTDICHVLRSRSQEARDQTRKALAQILEFVGPTYFGFILKELKGSLKRGYQLHVLSFTVHSLLVGSLDTFNAGDLDECLPHLMDVIMDDIFGVTGQEKDAEEYKSGMKEVKSSKSYDTMELLARVTPIKRLGALVRPVRNMLSEMLGNKSVKKIDDLLLRLRKGLDQNPEADSRDMLSFCWEIVNQVYAENNAAHAPKPQIDERRKRYEVQPEPEKKKQGSKGSTTSYRFKLIAFALNLLRKVVRRHEDLQTPANMAGFLPMAGDALIQGQEEVKLSAVRLLSTIMRVPIKQLEDNAPVYVREAVAMIKCASSSTTDASQAALELVTSVLRERRSVQVKEKDVALLLKRIKTDIDEPDRQGVIYKFLRAVLGRKIVITEVYEVMDEAGRAMVTNPDQSIRDSARSAYFTFVMEFPQGKDRWDKQTSFLVTNLKYKHASGRQSVMNFLYSMLDKVGEDVIKERAPEIFWTLVPLLVADSDAKCREMAELLIGKVFERAEDEKLMAQLLSTMETWLKKDKPLLKAGALQCWRVLLDTRQLSRKQLDELRGKVEDILIEQEEDIAQPQVAFDALRVFAALVKKFPEVGLAAGAEDTWQAIQKLPATDDARVQRVIAMLLGDYFTDFASASSKTADGLAGLPLRGSGGLELGAEDMRRLCLVSLRALRAVSLSTEETLTAQIVRNLSDLGRFFAVNDMPWNDNAVQTPEASDDENEDEENTERTTETAIAHLLRRLSSMLMADKFSVVARTAALDALSKTVKHISKIPSPSLQPILRPLYALTDPTVPKAPGDLNKTLQDDASELLDLMQKKLGQEKFLAALAVTRSEAKLRREERRQKRRIEAVAEPERWQKGKQRKYEVKKIKKKEKGHEARSQRRGW